MSHAKWTIGLADKGHTYFATAIQLQETEAWSVLLKVDQEYINALPTDDPTSLALQMIADAQLKMEEAPEGAPPIIMPKATPTKPASPALEPALSRRLPHSRKPAARAGFGQR